MKKIWIVAFSAVLLASCKVLPPKPPLVETIAILPFDSESNNVDAPDILQTYVYLALKPSAYRVLDIKDVNDKLAAVGIVDGGQLPVLDPRKIGKDFGVQALMYGNVASFGYLNVGFYRQKKVTVELKLVDATTGATLWENDGTGFTPNVATNKDEAAGEFVKGLADQAVDKLFKSPLSEEAKSATKNALSTLPGFSFHGFADDAGASKILKDDNKKTIKKLFLQK